MFEKVYISEVRIKDEIKQEQGYFAHLPAVENFKGLKFRKPVTFLVGENGTGKSTLLEAIAVKCGFNAEGGTKNFNFATEETHSGLYNYLTIARGTKREKDGFFLRAESFYNVATEVERLDRGAPVRLIDQYGGKSLHQQSHGESFMALMMNRFSGKGLYILDEPEAALSPSRQLALLSLMYQLVQDDSQFIIATHSPILLAYPEAEIFVLEEDGLKLTDYKETEHYYLTKQFLDNPEKMLRYLFED